MAEQILVALSGGVDSAVAAGLLKQQGCELTAIIMKICPDEPAPGVEPLRHGCYGAGETEDIRDAWKVANQLGIQFMAVDLCKRYEQDVLAEFKRGYAEGRTPNPCIYCNPRVKFGALVEAAEILGAKFTKMATGHYARVEQDPSSGRYLLKKGVDPHKDQSYFLAFLNQKQLSRALFPLGGYTKEQVRKLAAEMALPVSDKPESQDFVSGGCDSLIPETPPGPIMNKYGMMVGRHNGISHYTIGQHKGLSVSGGQKVYVIRIIPGRNVIIVGDESDLLSSELVASGLNWISVEKLDADTRAEVRIRSGAEPAPAMLHPEGDRVRVTFDEPQKAIAPGQAAVFYQGDVVLGAGIIEHPPADMRQVI
jgi:tRNA-uridine 2-sulfurtransferase